MSLVNDMLRDLDRRKGAPSGANRVRAAIPVHFETNKSKPWLLVLMVLAGMVIGILAGLYFFQQESSQPMPMAFEESAGGTQEQAAPGDEGGGPAAPELGRVETRNERTNMTPQVRVSETAGTETAESDPVPEAEADPAAEESPDALREIAENFRPRGYGDLPESAPAQDAAGTSTETPGSGGAARESIRSDRALSFEEQDRRASREGMQLIERGQINAAFNSLFRFVSQNPEAHRSRETLATLLLAQQEYEQAGMVVDEGLALAPNYAAYKKIKARLLSMEGRHAQGAELLREVPPSVSEDSEYHELMAALSQQAGQHEQAIEAYQDLIRFDGQRAKWWTGLAISLEASGEVEDALSGYEVALQLPGLDSGLRQYSQNRIRILSE